MKKTKYQFDVLTGPIFVSSSGHIHRTGTSRRYGRPSHIKINRGLLFTEYAPHSKEALEITGLFNNVSGVKVVQVSRKNYLREKSDGTVRLHRHKKVGFKPVGQNCFVVFGDDQEKLENYLIGKKNVKKTEVKKFDTIKKDVSVNKKNTSNKNDKKPVLRSGLISQICSIAHDLGAKDGDSFLNFRGKDITKSALRNPKTSFDDLKVILKRMKDKLSRKTR